MQINKWWTDGLRTDFCRERVSNKHFWLQSCGTIRKSFTSHHTSCLSRQARQGGWQVIRPIRLLRAKSWDVQNRQVNMCQTSDRGSFLPNGENSLFPASLEEAGPAVSGKDGACVCGRQKGICWRPAGYVHPTLEANATGEENPKVIQMVGYEHPLVREETPPESCRVVFPAPHWSSPPCPQAPPAPAPWRGLLWPPAVSSLPSLPSCVSPSQVLAITRNYCTGLFIGLEVLAFCLSSPVNQKLWEDGTMSVLLVTVSPKLRTVHGRQEV